MVVSPRAFDRLATGAEAAAEDEYFTRPYSAESIRWRVEAMCIRSQTVDDGSGPDPAERRRSTLRAGAGRATIIAVFNPKGGVGKTTVATNLASTLQIRKGQSVLLIDADTVTGHVTTSLGIDAVRTVADSWRDEAEGGPTETLIEIASAHPSGMRVVVADRLAARAPRSSTRPGSRPRSTAARRGFDVIVIDLHPSYSTLNQAIFDEADRILVPVTPDVPADPRRRPAARRRDRRLGCRERLAMVVNRANSGVSVADMERTVGMPALALDPLGRPALRPRRQRGPDGHRDVPEGEDHRRTSTSSPTACSASADRRPVPPKPAFRSSPRQKEAARA